MLWLKRIALLLAGLLVLLLTAAFFLENQTLIFLSFIGWKTPELPVPFFVLLAFAFGGALGALLGQLLSLGVKARLTATRRELARCRSALESARLQSPE